MSYATFPTLSRRMGFDIKDECIDPTARNQMGGYKSTRALYTRLLQTWDVEYRLLSDKDMDLLKAFERSINVGADAFYWINHREAWGRFEWAAGEALIVGQIRRPTTVNGHAYVVTAAGTTGGSEPVWPTSVHGTVASGGVTFRENSYLVRFAESVKGECITYGWSKASFKLESV